MFIYFPEFAYNKVKGLIKNTFSPTYTQESVLQELYRTFTDEDMRSILNKVEKCDIRLPKITLMHCINLTPISRYDLVANEISVCNGRDDLTSTLRKELTYFIEMNTTYAGVDVGLKELTELSLKACYNSFGVEKLSKDMRIEMAKRCGYVELKEKFSGDIMKKSSDMNIELEDMIKNLIEQNVNIII
jgi:hypothetical protein